MSIFSVYPPELSAEESKAIRQRRKWRECAPDPCEPDANPAAAANELPKDTIGLGLSGGGIRSATFNLGVLQALAKRRLLREVDVLSTISGGGYIGSFVGRFFDRL